jgi:GalNAc5-diNAcBac-PP-undecaprenol beta-1,3-glucosyltransferase
MIATTLDTIVAQSFTDFELIIVDDGGSDNTEEIVQSYQDERLKYFWKENEERSVARNFGMKQSNGSYLLFFDSDDLMGSNHLEVLDKAISNNPGFEVFSTRFKLLINGKEENDIASTLPGGLYSYKDTISLGGSFGILICLKNEHVKRFEPGLNSAEDWLFVTENLAEKKMLLLDEFTIHVVEHENRSVNDNPLALENMQRVADLINQRIALSEEEKKELYFFLYSYKASYVLHRASKKEALVHARKAREYKKYSWWAVKFYLKYLSRLFLSR